jgi:hypothetical protein
MEYGMKINKVLSCPFPATVQNNLDSYSVLRANFFIEQFPVLAKSP